MSGHLQYVERLDLHEQFKLVEIAHESKDAETRAAALALLRNYLNPLMVFVDEECAKRNLK